jgi:CheY-like chemotaxis protein
MSSGRTSIATTTTDRPLAGTVLLVEDEPAIRQLIAAVLEQEGYRVIQARNALEACALFDGHVDVLLTDIRLPYMDGRLLIQELRGRRQTLPVLAISAYAMNAPTDPDVVFLPKPFTHEELLNALQAIVPRV